jgi:hypothetical protein
MSTTAPRPAKAADRKGPLAGVKVVDLTTIVLGPLATLTLASLGADVIKVEAPDGDNVRDAGVAMTDGMGHVFLHGNRGKKSIVLDLKKPAAREVLTSLLAQADVFVCNVRPAAMKRLGLGREHLQSLNPRLIQVTACGYGRQAPYADKPAYDDLIQARRPFPADATARRTRAELCSRIGRSCHRPARRVRGGCRLVPGESGRPAHRGAHVRKRGALYWLITWRARRSIPPASLPDTTGCFRPTGVRTRRRTGTSRC